LQPWTGAPYLTSIAVMSLRNSQSPYSTLQFSHHPHVSLWRAHHHGYCGNSFMVLCAPHTAKIPKGAVIMSG